MSKRVLTSSAKRESINEQLSKLEEKTKKKTQKEKPLRNSDEHEKHDEHEKSAGTQTQPVPTDFELLSRDIKALFNEFDQKIDQKLEKFDQKFTAMFDDLKKDINAMKVDVSQSKVELSELKTKVNDIEATVEMYSQHTDEKTEEISELYKKSKQQLEEMETKFLLQEKHERQYNLLFYGFPEKENENLKETMYTFFKDNLELPKERVAEMAFANYHRVPSESKGPNPIIVKFLSMQDRDLVYSKAFYPSLRDEKKRILSDLPVKMKRERGRLATIAYQLRQSQKLKTRIVEKVVSVYLETRKTVTDPWERKSV